DLQDDAKYCLKACTTEAECGSNQVCNVDGSCWPGTPSNPPTADGGVGDACSSDTDCKDPGAICIGYLVNGQPTGFVNGYCLIVSCTPTSCPPGSKCFTSLGTACVATCESATDCRSDEGYTCHQGGLCLPGCATSSTCPTNYGCDAEANMCVPACTATSCPPGA
ncbi:MAG: hypothetical protein ACI9OJ_000957, partial [Myxococcota bacterium]